MFQNLTGWHFLILLVIILLLFGAPKLPGLAKSLGQSMRIFKGEIKTLKEEDAPATDAAAANTAAPQAPASPAAAPTAAPVALDKPAAPNTDAPGTAPRS